MGLKSDMLTNEACHREAARQCSYNDTDSFSSIKGRSGNNQHHMSNDTNKFLSDCSSHYSFSGKMESKASLRVSDSVDGMSMLSKVAAVQTAEEDCAFSQPEVLSDDRIFSNQLEKRKNSECNVGDISCVTRAKRPRVMGDISQCSVDQMESTSMRLETVTTEDHNHDALDSAESVKLKFEEDLTSKDVKCSE
ncbi:unnamed protein product, partial [Ilex paraguariensis]